MASGSGVQVRPLELGEDVAAAWRLAAVAFGEQGRVADRSDEQPSLPAGATWYGAFDSAGRVIGTAEDLWHGQWWGGRELAAADVAGVAVLPEARGMGAARALLKGLLEGAYERGAAVSALYPTVGAVYRASGWAVCGQLVTVDVATALLPTEAAGPRTLTVRPADPSGADQPAVVELYARMARGREGMLTRRGGPFKAPAGWPAGLDGISLVEDGGRLVGYASWIRGTGYRSDAVLTVPDLLVTTAEAARALLGVLAGWRSVTPTVRLRPLAFDAATALVPWESGVRRDARPWMHRPVAVTRAVQERAWPVTRRGTVSFVLHDGVATWNDGAWQLDMAEGEATLVRTDTDPDVHLQVAGFALLYSGVATPAGLVEAGLVSGPPDAVAGLDLLRGDTPAQLLDYF